MSTSKHPWLLVVAERGFIFAGRVHREGDMIVIDDAYTVLRFSHQTKDALGGLAARGPTGTPSNDSLSPQPRTRIPWTAMICDIACNQDAWESWHQQQPAPGKAAQ